MDVYHIEKIFNLHPSLILDDSKTEI